MGSQFFYRIYFPIAGQLLTEEGIRELEEERLGGIAQLLSGISSATTPRVNNKKGGKH